MEKKGWRHVIATNLFGLGWASTCCSEKDYCLLPLPSKFVEYPFCMFHALAAPILSIDGLAKGGSNFTVGGDPNLA